MYSIIENDFVKDIQIFKSYHEQLGLPVLPRQLGWSIGVNIKTIKSDNTKLTDIRNTFRTKNSDAIFYLLNSFNQMQLVQFTFIVKTSHTQPNLDSISFFNVKLSYK